MSAMQLHRAAVRADTESVYKILLALLLIVGCRAFRFSVLVVAAFVARLFLLLFLLGAIESGYAILVEQVDALWFFLHTVLEQRFGLDAFLVEIDDVEGTACADGDKVGRKTLVSRVGYFSFEDV